MEHLFAIPINGGRIKIGMPRNRMSILIRIKHNGETYENIWPEDEIKDLTGDCKIQLTCNELYKVWQHAFLGAIGFTWNIDKCSDKNHIEFVIAWDFLIVTRRRISVGVPNVKLINDSFFSYEKRKGEKKIEASVIILFLIMYRAKPVISTQSGTSVVEAGPVNLPSKAKPSLVYIFAMPIVNGRIKIGMPHDRSFILFRLKYGGETYEKTWQESEIKGITGDQGMKLNCVEFYKTWQYAFMGAKGFTWKIIEQVKENQALLELNWDFLIVTKRTLIIYMHNVKASFFGAFFFYSRQEDTKLIRVIV